MSDFAVVVQTVERTARLNRAAGEDLEARLRRLRHDVDQVLTGGWRGRQATSFDRAWSSWDDAARDVLAGLSQLCDLLVDAGHAYAAGDERAARDLVRSAS